MLFQGAIRLTLEMAWPAAAAPNTGKVGRSTVHRGFEGGAEPPLARAQW